MAAAAARHRLLVAFAVAAVWVFCAGAVRATSVQPPSFGELVDGSTLVFRGEVTALQSEWRGDTAHRHPATLVTFGVERVLKGSAGASVTLEFIGGTMGGHTLEIAGLPRFAVGQRGVFFVENQGGHLCPLMRLRYGQYGLVRDPTTGTERVVRADGEVLRSTTTVQSVLSDGEVATSKRAVGGALGLVEFENAIVARAERGIRSSPVAR